MLNKKTSRAGSIVAFIVSGIFVATAVFLFLNRQHVLDQMTAWSYEPSAQMESINDKVGFTSKGKFIFYATQPSLETQEGFNRECPRQETGSPILGCYTSADRIFIYDLTNEELDGIEEVTAAHEMLHAVWHRMSASEREKIGNELQKAYDSLSDKALKERMDYYARTEPGELVNELHSILGTEVGSLSESLETYYAQFYDRDRVLALHEKYNAIYTGLYSRADELYSNMQTLSSTIESKNAGYDAAVTRLSADINAFNRRADSGEFGTQSQFNAERAALVRRTSDLEAERQAINADIQTYNEYYGEYQEISTKIEGLNNSIDSFKKIDQGPTV